MMKNILIKKRDGSREEFDPNKIHKILFWATENITGVSVSQIETKSQLQLYPGISTNDIHEILIAAAHELISENTPNYQWVAARLRLFQLRKELLGQFEPWPLFKLVNHNVKLGYYTEELLSWYSESDFNEMDKFIDHTRDLNHAYAGMEQFHGKYLVQNRVTRQVYETPQYLNMMVAATMFKSYPPETRLSYVKEMYDVLSNGIISFPTPIMAGLRTDEKQFSSCVLIECADTLRSINATSSSIVEYISQKAGIGLEGGHIRALGSSVAGGKKKHTGVSPFYRLFQSSVKSCCLRPDMYVEVLIDGSESPTRMPISELAVGMNIKTHEAGKNVYKKVIDVWQTNVSQSQQVKLTFSNDTTIHCSINHPIMVMGDNEVVSQVMPSDLTVDDMVVSEFGIVYLTDRIVGQENPEIYIDISVEETHTFYTSDTIDGKMILTHNSQGGVRGGAATLYAPFWHYEIMTIMSLRSTKIAEDKAVRQMDYGIQFNSLAYERLITGGNITLFSPHEVPDLHEAFFQDQEKFKELYLKYERSTSIMKTTIPAIDLFSKYETERKETGRLYKLHVDHANIHGPFIPEKAPIKMSNLCAEICLPTKPVRYEDDPESEIALCTLAAFNLGSIKRKEDMELPLELVVRGLNEILDYQDYPVKAGETSTKKYRPLGVGITNLAYWLAKNGYKYSDNSAIEAWDEIMEAFQYYLIKASMKIAKEKGHPCPGYENTKYSRGIFTIDTYKKELDTDIIPHTERMDWKWLREQVAEYGMYNATLSAGMPCECQSLDNEIMLADGSSITLETIVKEYGMVDIETIHDLSIPGQRFSLVKPIHLKGAMATECYYNGPRDVTEIEFIDGNVYRFTENHKLQVNRDGVSTWVFVKDLTVDDSVCNVSCESESGCLTKIVNITPNVAIEHTWDISTDTETYSLSNGCISHNTSSQINNATNGFEPVRSLVTVKGSGEGRLKQVVPGFPRLKNKYELLWDQKSCRGYLNLCAISQKYFDQSISTNTFYNPENYQNEEVPMSELLQDAIYAYRIGLKTLYYCNSYDGATDEHDLDGCVDGGCKV